MENTTSVIEVLVDKSAGDLSIVTSDDSTGYSVETTLSIEDAWLLICNLNSALQQLVPELVQPKPKNKTQVEPTYVQPEPKGEPRVREAVLEAIDVNTRPSRYMPPGFPATVSKKGLRG